MSVGAIPASSPSPSVKPASSLSNASERRGQRFKQLLKVRLDLIAMKAVSDSAKRPAANESQQRPDTPSAEEKSVSSAALSGMAANEEDGSIDSLLETVDAMLNGMMPAGAKIPGSEKDIAV